MLEDIITTTNGIIAVVIVLGACIFFHELGHFTLAKIIGMRVHEFAIGFGRRLAGVRRGETEYRINLIPLGGYVRIAGMEPGAPPEERGFYRFPRWAGGTVLFAGSFMNVVLAALAFIAISIATGVPVFPGHSVKIRKVMPDTPAQAAGLQAGDQVIAIDGMTDSLLIDRVKPGGLGDEAGLRHYDQIYRVDGHEIGVPYQLLEAMAAARAKDPDAQALEVGVGRFNEDGALESIETLELPIPADLPEEPVPAESDEFLSRAYGVIFVPLGHDSALSYISERAGKPIELTVLRDSRSITTTVVPKAEWARVAEEDEQGRLTTPVRSVGRIGVVLAGETRPVSFGEAVKYGAISSVTAVYTVADGLAKMIRGEIAPQGSGPIGIAALTAERARIGWTSVAFIGGIISANLAVINLLPIPPFDGFRIVLLFIEGIMRRRVNERIEVGVTIAGAAVVLGLFLIISFRDILNLVVYQTP